jgi:class 3 adenylate cyclase
LTTLVFVDVEASTKLLERVGDDAGLASVGSQLGFVLDRVEAYGGTAVKSLGDGLLVTFVSPTRAGVVRAGFAACPDRLGASGAVGRRDGRGG